jgi:hypothetical protein
MAFLCFIKWKQVGSYTSKIRTMENIRTIAVIGASEERNFSILKELSELLPPLLSDNNKEALTNIHESLMAQNRHGDRENGLCPASWEADIIILSGFVLTMQLLLKE